MPLKLEPLEAREVPAALAVAGATETRDSGDYSAIAFVGGWGASMHQYAYNDPTGAGVPTDQFALNFAKIEYDRGAPPPASDYLLQLDGIKGESSDRSTAIASPLPLLLVLADQQDFYSRGYGESASAPPPAAGCLLKLDGVDGATRDGGRETIEITSWSLGATAPVSATDDVIADGVVTAENDVTTQPHSRAIPAPNSLGR